MADDDYTRDEGGRFASSGGGGGAKGGRLKEWAASRAGKSQVTPGQVLSGIRGLPMKVGADKPFASKTSAAPPRVWTDKPPAGIDPAKPETWQNHYDGHPDKGGKPSAERVREVHEPIIKAALEKAAPVPAGERKIAIMTMGAPASGKSSGLRAIDTSKFVHVDPDGIKEKLPEYQKATDPKATYRGAAMMAHEESSHLAKQIMSQAIAKGAHVVVDGTGTNAKSMIAKMQSLKAAGYHVHLAMSHLDAATGARRMVARAEEVGRAVPASVVQEGYQKVPSNFGAISKHADTFQVNDSRRAGSPMVWSKGESGEHNHHDPAFVRMFKSEHGG